MSRGSQSRRTGAWNASSSVSAIRTAAVNAHETEDAQILLVGVLRLVLPVGIQGDEFFVVLAVALGNGEEFVGPLGRGGDLGQPAAHGEVGIGLLLLDAGGLTAGGGDLLVEPGDGHVDGALAGGEGGEGVLAAFVERVELGADGLDAFLVGNHRFDRLRARHGELRGLFGEPGALVVEFGLAGGAFGLVGEEILAAGAFFPLEERGLLGLEGGLAGGLILERLLVVGAAVLEVLEPLLHGAAFGLDGVEGDLVFAGGGLAGGFLFLDPGFEPGDVGVGGGDLVVEFDDALVDGPDALVRGELAPAVAAEVGLGFFDEFARVGQRQPVFRPAQPTRDLLDAGGDEIHVGRKSDRIRP